MTESPMDDEQLQKLIGISIAYISIHPRSEMEIRRYVVKRANRMHAGEDTISAVMDRLTELGYANDESYARLFVESRMRSRPKGEMLLRRELQKKGIAEHIVSNVLHEQFHEADSASEYQLARSIAEKKWGHWHMLPLLEQKKKLFGLLMRRGFSQTVVHTIIDEYTKNNYNTVSTEGGEDAETPSV